jgi:hypothetical protein
MGSILNFIFSGYADLESGPFINYIKENYTYSSTPQPNKKNLLIVECVGDIDGNANYIDVIKEATSNGIKTLICFLSDPMNDDKIDRLNKKLNGCDYLIVSSNINTRFDDIITFDYFLEESTFDSYEHFFKKRKNDLGYISQDVSLDELNGFRKHKFLSFNRNLEKQHRLSLLHLYLSKLKDDSLFSFLFIEDKNTPIYDKTYYNENWFENLPIELDTHSTNITSFKTSNTFRKDLFLDTCLHIVTETSFNENELFISEKILKPIVMYQPFVVLGPVNYLSHLRSYGFKTFGDFWDESYDSIDDPQERYLEVQKLILSLNEMSIEEMNKLYQKTKEICIFNRSIHQSMYINSIPKVLERIENEW